MNTFLPATRPWAYGSMIRIISRRLPNRLWIIETTAHASRPEPIKLIGRQRGARPSGFVPVPTCHMHVQTEAASEGTKGYRSPSIGAAETAPQTAPSGGVTVAPIGQHVCMGYYYICGAQNETKPGFCGRPVSGPGVLCCCHGSGSCGHRGGTTGGQVDYSYVPSPREPVSDYQPTDRQMEAVADVVQTVLMESWEEAVADQLDTVWNDDFWHSLPRWSRKRPNCRLLARLAEVMESVKKSAHDAIGAMADEGLGFLGRPTIERRIANEFARRIPLPGDQEIAAVIHALRIYGIWICMPEGVDYVLTECPCFASLAKDKTKDALKELLKKKLNVLEARYRPTGLPPQGQ